MPATSWKMATQPFQILSLRGVRVTIVPVMRVLVRAASWVGGALGWGAARGAGEMWEDAKRESGSAGCASVLRRGAGALPRV